MGRNQIYCCICGSPFLEPGQSDDERGEWLARAVLVTTAHETDHGIELDIYWPQAPSGSYALDLGPNPPTELKRRVLRLDSEYSEHNQFKILESGATVSAFTVGAGSPTSTVTSGGTFYLAVHGVCNQLAEHFIDSRAEARDTFQIGPQDKISSIKQLWEVLYRRMPGSTPLNSEYILPEPHAYYGGRYCRNVYWEPSDDLEYGELLEENPSEIPNLTESILQNLQPASSEAPGDKLNKTNFNHQESNPKSEIVHNQDWWYDAFISKTLFPWLWDLDVKLIQKRRQEGNWDWKALGRQLSRVEIHTPSDETLNLPLGLRNRRRIWRLLEDARVDDIASDGRRYE
ncbi:uncharacterized protein F4822DRAFT_393052 [Hypoxylon trugodes]|uniref:uncharacterized protein n=1 Tax=Hypoxylon trugodes TaxID=326681 RepID=UPI00219A12C1|nr:uncharacterized protein F4822DRAFT_393052 [Hypoxylon trugodes]KAI1393090.1 hypothetical protein F4822DRAFT_393052 [Hypoxylon trugodes]